MSQYERDESFLEGRVATRSVTAIRENQATGGSWMANAPVNHTQHNTRVERMDVVIHQSDLSPSSDFGQSLRNLAMPTQSIHSTPSQRRLEAQPHRPTRNSISTFFNGEEAGWEVDETSLASPRSMLWKSISELNNRGERICLQYQTFCSKLGWFRRKAMKYLGPQGKEVSDSILADISIKQVDFKCRQRELSRRLYEENDTNFTIEALQTALESREIKLEAALNVFLQRRGKLRSTAGKAAKAEFINNMTLDVRRELALGNVSSQDQQVALEDQDSFDELCQSILSAGPSHGSDVSTWETDQLLLEGVASAGLYQCFCRACPVQKHVLDGHTAYLSLHPGNVTQDENPSGDATKNIRTERRMAIKSTVRDEESYIWLRVYSQVACNLVRTARSNSNGPQLVSPSQQGVSSRINSSSKSRKRRRSSQSPPRPSKVAKITPGQDPTHIRNAAYEPTQGTIAGGVRVCPQYLASHEDIDTSVIVMKMVDERGVPHEVSYLPEHLRPKAPSPIKLFKLLRNISGLCLGIPWVVNVSRLIVEAALRFDRFSAYIDGQRSRAMDDLVFYHTDNNGHSPPTYRPFLEVRMEGLGSSDSLPSSERDGRNDSIRNGRRSVLASLGHLLLQLGLKRLIPMDITVVEAGEMKSEIDKLCSELERSCSAGLSAVAKHCFDMCHGEKNDDEGDEEFYQWYYHNIVFPLKALDEELKKDEKSKNG